VEITAVVRGPRGAVRFESLQGKDLMYTSEHQLDDLFIRRPRTASRPTGADVGRPPRFTPNTWYTFRSVLSAKETTLSIDREPAMCDQAKPDLTARKPFQLRATDALLAVKSFVVNPLQP
jgi:hypothetical protein